MPFDQKALEAKIGSLVFQAWQQAVALDDALMRIKALENPKGEDSQDAIGQ